jgi:hypothetical protein
VCRNEDQACMPHLVKSSPPTLALAAYRRSYQ